MSTPKPPSWAKNAVATIRGWVDPRTGELLKAQSGLIPAAKAEATEVKEEKPKKVKKAKEEVKETVAEVVVEETQQPQESLPEDVYSGPAAEKQDLDE